MTDQILNLREALEEQIDALHAQREALEDEAPDEMDAEAFEDWLYACDDLEEQIEELEEQLERLPE